MFVKKIKKRSMNIKGVFRRGKIEKPAVFYLIRRHISIIQVQIIINVESIKNFLNIILGAPVAD